MAVIRYGGRKFTRIGRCGLKEKAPSAKLVDMTGQRFGRLVVLAKAESTESGAGRWLCRCDCGNIKPWKPIIVRGDSLRSGRSQSCGCLAVEATIQRAKDRPKVEPKPRAPRVPRSPPRLTSGGPAGDWRQFADKALARALANLDKGLDAEAKARG